MNRKDPTQHYGADVRTATIVAAVQRRVESSGKGKLGSLDITNENGANRGHIDVGHNLGSLDSGGADRRFIADGGDPPDQGNRQ